MLDLTVVEQLEFLSEGIKNQGFQKLKPQLSIKIALVTMRADFHY